MALKRLLAVVAALIMVVGAFVTRRFLDDGGELSLGGAQSRIYCDAILADTCGSVFADADLVIEAPGDTLDRFLDDTDDGAVVWIAADLWFDILEAERARVGGGDAVTSTSESVAHTPLVLAVGDGACAEVSWACVVDLDGSLGTGPLDSSLGLATQVQLVVSALGRPSFATNDPDFATWQNQVSIDVRSSLTESALLGTYLNSPGVLDAVAVTEAVVVSLPRETGAIVPADRGPDLEVRAVGLNDARLPGALDDLGKALVADGWISGSALAVERPSGGAMQALRQ